MGWLPAPECKLQKWTKQSCPECKCSETATGDSGRSSCKRLLDEAKASLGANAKIVLARFYCADNCGVPNMALTCFDPIKVRGLDKFRVGVCIPTNGASECMIRALIEHELTHVRDIIRIGGPPPASDLGSWEERAYRAQCEMLADQDCVTGRPRGFFIDDCIRKKIGQSTDPGQVTSIDNACRDHFKW